MSQEIIDYSILTKGSTEELATAVQSKIAGGWQPFGSMAAASGNSGRLYFSQPMIKCGPSELSDNPTAILYLQADNLADMSLKVTESIKEGWTPSGTLIVTSEARLYQVMRR